MGEDRTSMHVSELPAEIVGELGSIAIPDEAQAFDNEYRAALKGIELLMSATDCEGQYT